jgi:hypothetical protein
VQPVGSRRHSRRVVSNSGRVGFISALVVLLFVTAMPTWAAVTAPGSANVLPGRSVSVNVASDGSVVSVSNQPGISEGCSGSTPNFSCTFTAGSNLQPGSYPYTFFDDVGGTSGFTLIVDTPPTTTTPPTTAPPTTTTTRPRPTTTTTQPPEETTTTSSTTTVPPTTTTSTLIPAAIAALGDDDLNSTFPIGVAGGGMALLALVIAGTVVFLRRRPAYGGVTPGFMVAWRNRREERRAATLRRPRPLARLKSWWRVSGPVVSYQEWRSGRDAASDLQRRIEERRRLGGE